ncbi:SIS domain-containing protein [Microbacterium sp. 2FI]|uniref:SIS domain-containing protein n=1 Tax=Microbacterium sp. 2FI TaxID=2502193 RepID=UPI0010F94D9C|nr:SIS domain-containing protein [Microbacterium sp. 2FI]
MTADSVPGAHLRREIAEQPERWLDLVTAGRSDILAAASTLRRVDPQLLVLAGRGSSDHAAMYGQYLAHNLLGAPAMLATPASASVFGAEVSYPRTVVIAVSQSGASPDLLATVAAARLAGATVIGMTNDDASALAAASDSPVALRAGVERSVAATKTYTAELLALFLVIASAAGQPWHELEERVARAAGAARGILSCELDPSVVDAVAGADRALVVGRGYSMATAKEAALKLMETSALAASGWSAADATHGPLGQVVDGTPVLALTSGPAGRDSVESFAVAAQDRGGVVFDVADLLGGAEADDPELVPLLEILPLQRLALEVALRRGLDPDRPAGLRKVTLTR